MSGRSCRPLRAGAAVEQEGAAAPQTQSRSRSAGEGVGWRRGQKEEIKKILPWVGPTLFVRVFSSLSVCRLVTRMVRWGREAADVGGFPPQRETTTRSSAKRWMAASRFRITD